MTRRRDDEQRYTSYVLNQSQTKPKLAREKRKEELSEPDITRMENLQKEFDEAEDLDLIAEDATPPDRFALQSLSPPKKNDWPESTDEQNSSPTPHCVTRVRQEGLEKQATPLRRSFAQKSLEDRDDKSPSASFNVRARLPLPFYLLGFEGERTDFNELLYICHQQKSLRCEERFAKDTFARAVKIGEGSYGEVFEVHLDDQPCAIKVILFRDEQFPAYEGLVNGEYLNHTARTLPEVVTVTEFSKLCDCTKDLEAFMTPGFVHLHDISIVQGEYTPKLSAAWDRHAQLKTGSENDRPGDYATDGQLFLEFAMSPGGSDLERLKTEGEALSIFVQVALSLAVDEERLQFEHRDLHQTILVDKTPVNETIRFEFNNKEVHVEAHGVKATIIDFTFPRISKGGWTVFTDLAEDEETFAGQGSYQFDMYCMMRERNK